jgi:hypothetical protein
MRLYSGSNRFNSDSGDRMTGAALHAPRTPPAIPSGRTFHSHPAISGVILAAAGTATRASNCAVSGHLPRPGVPAASLVNTSATPSAFREVVSREAIAQEEGDSSAGQGCEEPFGKSQAIHPFRAGAQINPGGPGRILRQGADGCVKSGGDNSSPGCTGVL